MKAYQIKELAHPSKIRPSTDVPVPKPKKGEVLVEIYAAGLNFFDILQAQGKYQSRPPLPFVLGAEFSGRIAHNSPIPDGCSFTRGDRVLGFAQGAYAEYVCANPKALVLVPDNLSFEEAAVIILTYPTSYEGLVGRGRAKKGDWVLIHAGAGGVGLAACQIAKLLGCKVIATAGSDAKRRICLEKGGADAVVDYGASDWQKQVMKITENHGVDVVFDPVGLIIPSLKCVAWNARIVVVGFVAGTIEKVPANLLLLKQCSIVGLFWGETFRRDPVRAAQVMKDVMGLLSSGKLRSILYEPIYDGLDKVSDALVDLEQRRTWGKGVIRVRRGAGERAKL